MKSLKELFAISLCLTMLFNLSASLITFAECSQNHTVAQVGDEEEFGPLQIFTQDLLDVFDLIDEGNKKTALTILKSAKNEIRKIKEFDSLTKKSFSKKVDSIGHTYKA
jgi:hypothetical protein